VSATQFSDFNLPEPLNRALKAMGYESPTPVQAQAIPLVQAGRDVLATAQTGTGKTAAFAIPLLARMLTEAQEAKDGTKKDALRPSLVIAPTRELAEQIGSVLKQLTQKAPHIKVSVIIGGMAYQQQIRGLRAKPAFVVGTPGRLIDQVTRGNLDLSNFGSLVIDEADRLLDMGFEPQVNQIVMRLPRVRQTMMFSATMAPEIQRLAATYLKHPERVAVGSATQPVDRIKQSVVRTKLADKPETLIREIDKIAGSILVFVRTRSRAELVMTLLSDAGHKVARIHGERTQRQRSEAIEKFRAGKARILVATDIAARGIDIPDIQHVVNFDLPLSPEDYVHRIGRTARAGAAGHSLAFVTPEEELQWAKIHKLMYGRYPQEFKRPQPSRFGGRGGGGGGKFGPRSPGKSQGKGQAKSKSRGNGKSASQDHQDSKPGQKRKRDESHKTQFTRGRKENAPGKSRPSGKGSQGRSKRR
jgi:ATP-dependent RNA helicase DeaD